MIIMSGVIGDIEDITALMVNTFLSADGVTRVILRSLSANQATEELALLLFTVVRLISWW